MPRRRLTNHNLKHQTVTMILEWPDATTDPHDRAQDLQAAYHEMAFEMAIIRIVTSVVMTHDDRCLCNTDARDHFLRASVVQVLPLGLLHPQDEASVDLVVSVMKAWKWSP